MEISNNAFLKQPSILPIPPFLWKKCDSRPFLKNLLLFQRGGWGEGRPTMHNTYQSWTQEKNIN